MPKPYPLLIGLLLLLSGCYFKRDDEAPRLPVYRPLLMSRATLEQSIAWLAPRELRTPGRICRQGTLLYINERYEGVHVIDNQDPTRPVNRGFVRIPGTLDLSVRGSVLYADNGVDLVTVDVGTPGAARVLGRVVKALPELPLPEVATIETGYRPEDRPADAVVIGWQKIN